MALGFDLNDFVAHLLMKSNILLSDNTIWNLLDRCELRILSMMSNSESPSRRRVAKEYILANLKNRKMAIDAKKNQLVPNDQLNIPLQNSISHVIICGDNEGTFSIVSSIGFRNLTKITFNDLLHQKVSRGPYNHKEVLAAHKLAACIRDPLKNLKRLEFNVNQFKGPIFDKILENCKSIQSLTINTNRTLSESPGSYQSRWYYYTYTHLTSIQWDDGIISRKTEFRKLLQLNPKIKNIKFTKNLLVVMEFIDDFCVELDILSVKFGSSETNNASYICRQLVELHQKSRFKKLHVTTNDLNIISIVATLPALERIAFNGPYTPAIASVHHLKELIDDSLNDGITNVPLRSLEFFHAKQTSVTALKSFVCQVPNLRTLIIGKLHPLNVSDLDELINERRNLIGAHRLIIYLQEWAYVHIKNTFNVTAIDSFIEIKRIESLEIDF